MKTQSKDAYFIQNGNTFVIGTKQIEKKVSLNPGGSFSMTSYLNKKTGSQYLTPEAKVSDEFEIVFNGQTYSGSSGGWMLQHVDTCIRDQGELEVILILNNDVLKVERHYVAYPGVGVIQEWSEFENITGADAKIDKPRIFIQRLLANRSDQLDFHYMTGAANFSGSCVFKSVPLSPGYTKDFDSQGAPEMMEVDGTFVNKWHPRFNGVGIWFEFMALRDREKNEGWYLTFDYQGWWKSHISNRDGELAATGWCELRSYEFRPGAKLKMPPMMTGVFTGDVDDLGNTINEYIYAYKWDYTRDRYFNRTNLTIWRTAPLAEKVFKMVDMGRYIGVERVWVDDFWFDAKGNWNGIFGDDWKVINSYIRKHGMAFRLWMPPWHADRLSQVSLDHPEWMLDFHGNWYNWTIDMSQEEAYQWILNMLCDMQKKIGTYDLRVDGDPCNLKNNGSFDAADAEGDWNGTFLQSQNFYRLYKEFKDRNPEAGLDGCSSGGHTLTIEAVRYTDQQQITDGECKHLGGYWTTMVMPIDKHQGMPIASEKQSWWKYTPQDRQLFSALGYLSQNPEEGCAPESLEGKRKDMELFRWLRDQGVYGRWIKVYRPSLEYGDPTFIMQRMTWDHRKGLIMISCSDLNPIIAKSARIYPKGLLPDEDYTIEALENGMATQTQKGSVWMRDGILLDKVVFGENLLINLPGRPGQGTDREPPTPPAWAKKRSASWLGHEGIDLEWAAASDNVMVSYYAVSKNGHPYTKVSTGTFFFDSAGKTGDEFQIQAVDGDGNASPQITAVVG
jgi:hypothetical protein